MSKATDSIDVLFLNLFKDVADCVSVLEVQLQEETEPVRKVQCIRIALVTIQELIHIESQTFSAFSAVNIKSFLLSVQHLLLHFEKVHSKPYPKHNTIVLQPILPSPNVCNTNQKVIAEDQEKKACKELVTCMKIKPRVKGLKDIAGLVDAKKVLATIVILPIHQPQLYEGRKLCNSILLYGPPGTGKTLLAHATAAEISAHLFSVTGSDILSQYVGQTEKKIQAIFEVVREPRQGPTILFIDEIDGLCRTRTSTESDWGRRLKTELMCQLSDLEDRQNVFLICATNCPWDLDTAFLRRFQRRIYIPLPNANDRYALLQLLVQNCSIQISAASWGAILNRTEGYSGSDLADVVRNAINLPITELLDNRVWKLIENDKYQPLQSHEYYNGTIVNCGFHELPPGSIKARDPHVGDLLTALEVVRPTVSISNIRQFELFIRNA